MPRSSRRDDLLRAASARFFRDGIMATGVDTVVADAGVAKMTLYSNFGSKDELVTAYLSERDRHFFTRLDAELAAQPAPLARCLTPVALYRTYLDEQGFHGCAFVNAGAELPAGHPGRAVILAHKRKLLDRWTELIADLGTADPPADPPTLARECFLLLEGAFTQAGIGMGTDLFDAAERAIRDRLTTATDY